MVNSVEMRAKRAEMAQELDTLLSDDTRPQDAQRALQLLGEIGALDEQIETQERLELTPAA